MPGAVNSRALLALTALGVASCSQATGMEGVRVVSVSEDEIQALPGTSEFAQIRDLDGGVGGLWVLDSRPPYVTFLPENGRPPTKFGVRVKVRGSF